LLKARVAGRFYAALDEDAPWAVMMGMRNLFGWDNGRSGFQVSLTDESSNAGDGSVPRVEVEFIFPSTPPPQLEHRPPKDITPRIVPQPRLPEHEPPSSDPGVIKPNLPNSGVPIMGRKRGFDWS
jgi:hypothetical protein